MHRERGDTFWSACLITILAPTARVLLAVPLALRILAPLDGRPPRSTIGCAGLDIRRQRISGSPVYRTCGNGSRPVGNCRADGCRC
ncbi:hypothetical protein PF010_g4926 [Phytophthora fragariae]|uniref:Uncharacterized protein n=1 Tax=Phytophthora fragariae TaxID=53985 RepID=A0A6G0LQR3_9STRA|nr:hypothetical protein PF010_g4926 [Phytophthora fragariae]